MTADEPNGQHRVQQRLERDHQHLKGRLRPLRGVKTLTGARVLCAGHAFLRNLRGGFYDHPEHASLVQAPPVSPIARIWDALMAELSAR